MRRKAISELRTTIPIVWRNAVASWPARRIDEHLTEHAPYKGHVAGTLDRPLVILLEQDGADEPGDSSLIRKDANDLGPALDLAVEAFEWVRNRYEEGGAEVRC